MRFGLATVIGLPAWPRPLPPGRPAVPGLVAAYSFDEGSGRRRDDASGNGHCRCDRRRYLDRWPARRRALASMAPTTHVGLGSLGTFYQGGFTLQAWVQKATTKNDVGRGRHLGGQWPDALGRPPRNPLPPDAQRRPLELPRLRRQPGRRQWQHLAPPTTAHRALLHRRDRGRESRSRRRRRQLRHLAGRRLRQQPRRLLRRPDRRRPRLQPAP